MKERNIGGLFADISAVGLHEKTDLINEAISLYVQADMLLEQARQLYVEAAVTIEQASQTPVGISLGDGVWQNELEFEFQSDIEAVQDITTPTL